MAKVVLLTGSNLGNKIEFLNESKTMLSGCVGVLKTESSFYKSAPWGFNSNNFFINQVLVYETELSPHNVLREINSIEKELGRVRSGKGYSDRVVDIDILFYDDVIMDTDDLTIPHPRLHKRRFTLEPLNEILPEYIHPLLNKSFGDLIKDCDDLILPQKLDSI